LEVNVFTHIVRWAAIATMAMSVTIIVVGPHRHSSEFDTWLMWITAVILLVACHELSELRKNRR